MLFKFKEEERNMEAEAEEEQAAIEEGKIETTLETIKVRIRITLLSMTMISHPLTPIIMVS
jgi:hypothetical protein